MPYSFIRDVPFNEEQHAEIRSLIGVETPKGLIPPPRHSSRRWPALHRRLGRSGGFGEVPATNGYHRPFRRCWPLTASRSRRVHSPWK